LATRPPAMPPNSLFSGFRRSRSANARPAFVGESPFATWLDHGRPDCRITVMQLLVV
jgi:hypothetical protein